ncbi:ATPase family associated with various cellular activities (AAA) family protein [Theileria parva strain Muguga]|uniref:ATPase family associated with various cellular activities (AAA) family protein n=1 Tax=Theileria parva strain Muguga TaxID=333668 RepID=UPI001C61E448|nr:ATPase family associated with various cellular activities (AAA) family protein [Theileria parva strain Muguga]EAN31214.2 ATPase family associated with various cellular activities (AAA) family protein [Theileria parva strain Muguga]
MQLLRSSGRTKRTYVDDSVVSPIPEHIKGIKRTKTKSDEAYSYVRDPYGEVIANINGKKFYRSALIHDEIISIYDSVDVLRTNNKSKNVRESNLAKISAIYVDTNGKLMAEVAFYFDSGEEIPTSDNATEPLTHPLDNKWKGFTHVNEVVAYNKFEDVEIETFDEKVNVHGSKEEYLNEINSGGDEEINVFCNYICYHENYSVLPFNIHTDWENVMVESSKYHSIYYPKMIYKETPCVVEPLSPELKLQLNSTERILGREDEADKIRTFMETNIKQGGTGQVLYISGVPGTGKTETVKMVSKELIGKKLKGQIPWFDLVEINAVHLSRPNELYRVFYNKLFAKPAPASHICYEELDKYFTNNMTPCVLIVDEADYIVTKTQKVLFNLFDLPCKKSSKFILIIISNTMDLNYKMKSSIQSRLGFGSLVFKPYRYQQIVQVIESKLGKYSIIDPVALQLCARRVTNYSGDMRKALQICKLAIKESNGKKITVSEMSRISNMVLNSSISDALQYVSVGMKCLLVSIILVLKEVQLSIAPAVQVYNTFRGMITVLKPELENCLCKDSFKHLLLSSLNNGVISLEPTVFSSFSLTDKKKIHKVFEDINEDLGDVGITFQIDIGHLVTALAKDPYWQSKLESIT